MNLRKKVFLAFMAFILVPFCVLGAITYLLSQHIIEENYAEQSEFTLKAVGRNITYVLKEANYFSEDSMLREDIQRVLRQDRLDQVSQAEYERLLQRTFLKFSPAYAITLYSFGGNTYSEGKIGYRRYPYESLIEHPVMLEVLKLNGIPRWIGPYENPEITNNPQLFTQIRVINDMYTLNNIGVMLQQFQFNELHEIFNYFGTNHSEDVRFMMVNENGLIMIDNKGKLGGRHIQEVTKGKLELAGEYQSLKTKFEDVESVVSVHHLALEGYGRMNWSVVSVTPWAYLSGRSEQVMLWIGVITALCVLSALLFNLLFVGRIIKFIRYVAGSMKKVEIGDLTVRVQTGSKDETNVLARGFNSLVERIDTLLLEVKLEQQRKNKAELMLMQAQIKPHFLFNTLESINALAAQNEGRKVSRMVQRLGTLLRVSFYQKEEIPLSMEIEHVTNYLEIQKYRFEDLFDYEIEVPVHLASTPILKLTLQPLLENSIQHGFEESHEEHWGASGKKGFLRVAAEETEDAVIVWVEDNGPGIPEQVLLRLNSGKAAIARTDAGDAAAGERVGLGIPNVADRLRIHYGSGFGMMICSEKGQGTRIRCSIPKRSW
ncbi:HAMP domain-containing protein [Paenibacillus sp. UNCCL117]|uniref:sensor histidine kinase n=1 Tax=unclassified Paenibacillus TaxID=185978 RepID=UPI00088A5343|nr:MULTISPECIES: sensor histidine kinase [unclassified Paenibacillus]SDD71054.1 HAMP domain-containing protein [Paenibacillus sp. cl123]SFW45463.1 HAMP domain-containing protein [Paenibacillus sp. UNCCL117]